MTRARDSETSYQTGSLVKSLPVEVEELNSMKLRDDRQADRLYLTQQPHEEKFSQSDRRRRRSTLTERILKTVTVNPA